MQHREGTTVSALVHGSLACLQVITKSEDKHLYKQVGNYLMPSPSHPPIRLEHLFTQSLELLFSFGRFHLTIKNS